MKVQLSKLCNPLERCFSIAALLLLLPCLIFTSVGYGAFLQWDANKEANLGGYKVYWGTSPGGYYAVVDVGKTTTYEFSSLREYNTYYIAVTAYNTSRVESDLSEVLVFYVDDGVPSFRDNCPTVYNPCQEDSHPPGGNGIGDACECEADFNCDGRVDANDARKFISNFGRSLSFNPCNGSYPCDGDFNCDGNVDANDYVILMEDFGRSPFNNPCPACVAAQWCEY